MNVQDLQSRLARLEAVEAIRALKARYGALADAKYTPHYQRLESEALRQVAHEQAMCFTEDVVWAGGDGFGGDICGREQLTQWFMRSPWRFAMHYYTSAHIDVNDNQASAAWRLWQLALREDDGDVIILGATTTERYRLEQDQQWRCCFMQFEQLHMCSLGLASLPLAQNLAALDALVSSRAHTASANPLFNHSITDSELS
ncbi:nuclear transport factor 2 family protein [Advenella mimigardefordensis]|uniref:SnoaL-like domain-containing protein n=1 Tax=Advenella mimigardefordensis (strain DSM 17166 / LMG 22922 / DPN7) TaxID=1247726 RepID=W0PHG3_ADVMD|nr:nuclear transport factor 2 family protein [Advenella mimigardefordensis]AHG65222.1 hypothetical protein MIM_c31580 [Advenella mimigardefordensis DPN7]